MKDSLISWITFLAKPAVAIGGSLVLGAAIIGYVYVSTAVSPSGATAKAVVGSITQEVDVTGTVQAAQTTDLAFQVSGRIASIGVQVGQHVERGQTLLALDAGSQQAALAGAEANLEAAQANLASLLSGTRPEQLSIDETNVAQTKSALGNALQSAYVSADDAVHVKADALFTNPRTGSALLALSVPDAALVATIEAERNALEPELSAWQAALASAPEDPATVASTTSAALSDTSTFLDNLAKALAETPVGGSLSATALAADQVSVNAGRTEVATALSSVTTALTAYRGATGALALAEAGATPDAIAASRAAVDAASAAVESAQVALGNTTLTAPVSGTVTVQSANPGQTVTPGSPLVSMLADGSYEAKGQVSEADIGKVAVGDAVIATFDTYPGATFPATVTTVDPAATVLNGVSSYGVTVTFAERDPRLVSGLSANLRIVTATKDGVVMVPTSAIITDGTGSFVYVLGPKGPVKTQVVTGIESASGTTEITSGLSAGATVLTYGASASY